MNTRFEPMTSFAIANDMLGHLEAVALQPV
jgi:hypothetical protein